MSKAEHLTCGVGKLWKSGKKQNKSTDYDHSNPVHLLNHRHHHHNYRENVDSCIYRAEFQWIELWPAMPQRFCQFLRGGAHIPDRSVLGSIKTCVVRSSVNLYRFPPSWICRDFNPRDLSFFVCLQTSDWDETNLKETVNEIKHSQSCKASSSFVSKHKIC